MAKLRSIAGFLSGVPFAVIYGVLARLAFGADAGGEFLVSPLSVAFLLLVPVAIGALAVALAPAERRTEWAYALGSGTGACLIAAIITGVLAIEAAICIAMASPILMAGAAIGAALACWLARRRARERSTLIGLLLMPFLAAPLEARVPVEDSWGTVETQVVIEADAATVWRNLVRVAPIRPEERRFSLLFDLFGVPRPLEATLPRPGPQGERRGWFEDHLMFVERIAAWEPERRISWEIRVGDRSRVPAPWSEIGGRAFDVSEASYWIEPVDAGTVILHLDSRYRLSTRFNEYGALWAGWGLSEFQGEVLHVIKARSEAEQR